MEALADVVNDTLNKGDVHGARNLMHIFKQMSEDEEKDAAGPPCEAPEGPAREITEKKEKHAKLCLNAERGEDCKHVDAILFCQHLKKQFYLDQYRHPMQV